MPLPHHMCLTRDVCSCVLITAVAVITLHCIALHLRSYYNCTRTRHRNKNHCSFKNYNLRNYNSNNTRSRSLHKSTHTLDKH